MPRLTACPGSGAKPAEWPNVRGRDLPEGYAVCSRCGRGHKLRADGRIKAHRVDPSTIVPAIGGRLVARGTALRYLSERR